MNLELNKTVGELASEIPGATRVFEKVGIDYCCGGKQSIVDACKNAGVTVKDLMMSIESATKSPAVAEHDFVSLKLGELIDHIVETHHVFTKSEIERLRALLNKVCGVHGQNHSELTRLRSLFEVLSAELEPHMMKEERILFPYIFQMENATQNHIAIQTPPFGTVANPIRMMMIEHDRAGELLKEMRELTANYSVPADGCISYQTLYQALDAFEKDLHQHIHLENNILFPRAENMELGL